MIRRCSILAVLLLLLWIPGSAGAAAAEEFNFSIDMPEAWWRVKNDNFLVITKDGAFKHYILVQERPLLQPFTNTGKSLQSDYLPSEAARVIADELSADPNLTGLQMIENIPATVAGRRGFRLTFLYTDPAGMVFKTVYYGCIKGDHFYNLRYSASDKAYFSEQAWREFSGVLKSFKIK